MRIFKNNSFAKFAHRECISDEKLFEVIREADKGNIDADYGSGLIKQRISRPNQGKSSGYRSIIYYRHRDRAFFVYGFSKKDRNNIDSDEKKEFKRQAKLVLTLDDKKILKLLENGTYEEVHDDDKN
ncbi:MAG: addiction module toxin RelE [Alphaproteobacteria bacterium 16-39-46]|nr:MAG: addiction module toxin RelE [Alphaproteobacteria bacterium 16-39-46]OZA42423.1 MAG: addiction module toxin RelE [Alphaproteobacteria bacterium 17-39-52]HQS83954.1 type II toxin-antitoxin system RelE/ParE family toxin [Alphaproteobacteria bacterium]HQS93800.1 type II toxin-antitoxin system RelE/ParE family toxin [Alphaproteobacteria bacterium]